jgi:two-component system CheB/CheR fusion protein
MDGHELLRALRRRDDAQRTPVIAVTAFGRAANENEALAAGFAAYLRKPVDVQDLMRTLTAVLRTPGRAEDG